MFGRIHATMLTSNSVLLHSSNLFQSEPHAVYHKGHFSKIYAIAFVQFQCEDEEYEQNQKAGACSCQNFNSEVIHILDIFQNGTNGGNFQSL